MADPRQFRHHYTENTAWPYISNANVVDTRPHYVDGNNVMMSIRGIVEKRFGFPTYTSDNFGANNTIKRFFCWQRWNSDYYVMLNVVDTSANSSKVYKQKVGTDATFVLIHTSAANTNPFDFVVANNFVFFANGTDQKKYDGTTVYSWGTAAPTMNAIVDAGAGNVPGSIGNQYVAAFYNSTTGYLSDISSTVTTSAASRQWTVSGPFSSNAYIDKVRIFRTEDGGSVFYELSGSPVTNPGAGNWTITDNTTDAQLSSTQAPLASINAVPNASSKGPVFYAGRIWMFNGDTLYYSGLEEVTNGIPEESFPSINQRAFGREILGLGVTRAYLLVFTSDAVFRINGDSLATFSTDTLSLKMGVRNRATVVSESAFVAWLDTANVVRITDGEQVREISIPIRPDIASIDHSQASMAVYDNGQRKWLVLCDGGAGKLRVFDLDMNQWYPPWGISGCSAVGTGETAQATTQLFLGKGNAKPLAISTSTYQDDGSSYVGSLTTGLMNLTSDGQPTDVGVGQYVSIETNSFTANDVSVLVDEDPSGASFTSVVANVQNPANRTNGTNLVEKWYWCRPGGAASAAAARRMSVKVDWSAATNAFKLYSFDLAYYSLGSAR